MLCQPLGEIERRRPADIMREITVHFLAELRIGLRLGVSLLQFQDQRHQRLGDETATIDAEMPALVRPGAEGIRLLHGHAGLATGFAASSAQPPRVPRGRRRESYQDLCRPGARSTPEETSTPGARVMRKASPTLPASSPPESMNGTPGSMCPSKAPLERFAQAAGTGRFARRPRIKQQCDRQSWT